MTTPSRRELLAAFLGLPALAGGCAKAPPPLPEGQLVGASDTLGHRLRAGPPPRPADSAWRDVPVVIVGAGVAGLAAGWRLERAGFRDFVVLELESAAGGTSRSGTEGVVPHPWGAHYLPAPFRDNVALCRLLEEMEVIEGEDRDGEPIFAEQVLCRDPQERLWHRGIWYEGLYLQAGASSEDQEQYRRFFAEIDRWVGWRDGRGRRAFALPLRTASDDADLAALDRQTMAEWLDERGFTSWRLRWLIDYACRDDYGAHPTEVSAWAGLFYFCARRKVPGGDAQPYLTWPEGNGRLIQHLAGAVRGRLLTDLAVADLHPTDPPGQKGVELIAWRAEGGVQGFRADQVIFAAPQFVARYVLRPWREHPPEHLAQFTYGSWAVANLHLRDRPVNRGAPLAWDNVLSESRGLGYVVATHQKGLDHGPTIFTWYYPQTEPSADKGRRELLSLSWRDWVELALSDLERAHPELRSLCHRLDVMRWGHAMIRPSPGFVLGAARRRAREPYRGIHFAHSDLSGVALFEEAFDQGIRAAEEVLAARREPDRFRA
jgi:protoporphyrinogen oxidase